TRFSPKMCCPSTMTGSMAPASNVFEIATSVTVAGSRRASLQASAICRRTPASGVSVATSFRIVKNDAKRMPVTRAQAAHPVSHIDPIGAAAAAHRPMVHGKNDALALPQRNHFGARLHARALLGQHELPGGEIVPRAREQKRDLQRKRQF